MDRLEFIRAMSIRRLATWALGLTGGAALGVSAAVAWHLGGGDLACELLILKSKIVYL